MSSQNQIKITLYVPFSRPWAIEPFFTNLNKMDLPRESIELVVLIDTEDQNFVRDVNQKIEWLESYGSFGRVHSMATVNKPLDKKCHVIERRMRIVENWGIAKKMFGKTDWFFGLEDDTLCPSQTFWNLFNVFVIHSSNELIKKEKEVVYVEGAQAYRQVSAVGAWHIGYKEAYTLAPHPAGIEQINGGGFFCFLTKTEYIKKHKFMSRNGLFSSDVDFVHRLSYKGLCFINWGIQCGHLLENGKILFPDTMGQIVYVRNNGEWERVKD